MVCQTLVTKTSAGGRCCSLLFLQGSAFRTHTNVFTLWIPFRSQGYKYSPCSKPKGLAWNQSWPASRDVTQNCQEKQRLLLRPVCSRNGGGGGEILQLKVILRALSQRQSYELLSDNMLSQQPSTITVVQDKHFCFPSYSRLWAKDSIQQSASEDLDSQWFLRSHWHH